MKPKLFALLLLLFPLLAVGGEKIPGNGVEIFYLPKEPCKKGDVISEYTGECFSQTDYHIHVMEHQHKWVNSDYFLVYLKKKDPKYYTYGEIKVEICKFCRIIRVKE